MSVIVRIQRAAAANKPRHGAPCNRCGVCCMASLCKLGQLVLDVPEFPGPCPALVTAPDGMFACGLTFHPGPKLAAAARLLIGAGDGCDARINGEPRDEAFAARLDRQDSENAEAIKEARALWHKTKSTIFTR